MNLRRHTLTLFLMWAGFILSVSAVATKAKVPETGKVKDELVREVENLEKIEKINSGQLDSAKVGLNTTSTVKTEHLSARRSTLSQR